MKSRSSKNGPAVALLVLGLCLGGFLATMWNYSRTHPFAESASVVSRDGAALIEAVFPASRTILPGQRVVVAFPDDSTRARGGTILAISDTGTATITLDSEIPAPAGTKVTVSIDGTVGPQPLPQKP